MTTRTKLTVTGVLLLVIGALGFADYQLSEEKYTADVLPTAQQSSSAAYVEESSSFVSATSEATTSVSSVPSVPSSTGVAKQQGPDTQVTLQSAGFAVQTSNEQTFLSQVAQGKAEIHSLALLQTGDRVGSVSWVETGDVKTIFVGLKEALLTAFSPKMRDLRDETLQEPGMAVRNVLTFVDPALSADRLTFIRIRERLYEFHSVLGKETQMQVAMDALMK